MSQSDRGHCGLWAMVEGALGAFLRQYPSTPLPPTLEAIPQPYNRAGRRRSAKFHHATGRLWWIVPDPTTAKPHAIAYFT